MFWGGRCEYSWLLERRYLRQQMSLLAGLYSTALLVLQTLETTSDIRECVVLSLGGCLQPSLFINNHKASPSKFALLKRHPNPLKNSEKVPQNCGNWSIEKWTPFRFFLLLPLLKQVDVFDFFPYLSKMVIIVKTPT